MLRPNDKSDFHRAELGGPAPPPALTPPSLAGDGAAVARNATVKPEWWEHDKRRELREQVSDAGEVALIRLWSCSESLMGKTDAEIAKMAGWSGDPKAFVLALRHAKLLDGQPRRYRIHDLTDHNPTASLSDVSSESISVGQLVEESWSWDRWHDPSPQQLRNLDKLAPFTAAEISWARARVEKKNERPNFGLFCFIIADERKHPGFDGPPARRSNEPSAPYHRRARFDDDSSGSE